MKTKLLIGVSLLGLVVGCSTVTKPVVNQTPAQPQISPVLAAEQSKGLKRKVAIARFSNETKHGNSFLLNESNDRVGKQAMDILSARLTETGKFLMMERADLDKIKSEQQLSGADLQTVGADYLVVGSVSEFGRSTQSEVGVFSRNKMQTARAKVNIRLIDVATGQIIYSQEGAGESTSEANKVFGVGADAGYDSSLDDAALSAAISKLVSNVVESLLDKPWQAYVIGEQDGLFIVTGGKSQGIKEGDEFNVMKRGKQVKNPQTGLMIELPAAQAAKLKVVALAGDGSNEISLCSVVEGNLAGTALEQLVVREIP